MDWSGIGWEIGLALGLAVLLAACAAPLPLTYDPATDGASSSPTSSTEPNPASASPCGATRATAPATYDHVIWILEENHDLRYDPARPEAGVFGNPAAPFLTQLAAQCTYSTQFIDTHPGMHSEPHYLAAVSGSNCNTGFGTDGTACITDDKSPSHHVLDTPNLFSQVAAAGKTWRSYQESAPQNCYRAYYADSHGEVYGPKHDPALYFTDLNATCPANDIAFPGWTGGRPTGRLADDITQDQLPAFTFIAPNERNDMHISTGGNAAAGDAWLAAYLPLIFASPSYRAGKTAVFVLWDETFDGHRQETPNLLIAPTAHAGPIDAPMNNIAVLRATQQMLGLTPQQPLLGCASGQPPGGAGRCPAHSTADVRDSAHI